MLKQGLVALSILISGATGASQVVNATTYTPAEQTAIRQARAGYRQLPQTRITQGAMALRPFFGDPYFSYRSGQTTAAFQHDLLTIYNYYRRLFYLAPVSLNAKLTAATQQASDIMAYTLPLQHGVSGHRPWNVHPATWQAVDRQLKQTNLHMVAPNLSVNQTAVGFLADNTNLSGANAGHRLNLLNPGLKAIGVGVALKNGARGTANLAMDVLSQRQSAQYGMNNGVMSYPQAGAFPIELLPQRTPLSLVAYNPKVDVTQVTRVVVTDNTTGQSQTLSGRSLVKDQVVINPQAKTRTLTFGSGTTSLVVSGAKFVTDHRYTVSYQLANGTALLTTHMVTYSLRG